MSEKEKKEIATVAKADTSETPEKTKVFDLPQNRPEKPKRPDLSKWLLPDDGFSALNISHHSHSLQSRKL